MTIIFLHNAIFEISYIYYNRPTSLRQYIIFTGRNRNQHAGPYERGLIIKKYSGINKKISIHCHSYVSVGMAFFR